MVFNKLAELLLMLNQLFAVFEWSVTVFMVTSQLSNVCLQWMFLIRFSDNMGLRGQIG